MKIRRGALAIALVCGGAALGAAQPDRPDARRFRGGVDVVALDVCVKDHAGRPAAGLTGEDFLVLEDNVPQHLAIFSNGEPMPLAVSLLIDTSLSMSGAPLDRARGAARGFIASLQPGDLVEIIAFNDSASVLYPLGDDLQRAAASLGPLAPAGMTALYRAILAGMNGLQRSPRLRRAEYRRVVVVLSDGENTRGATRYEDLLDAARRSGVLVYTISLRTDAADRTVSPPWEMAALARDTGGRATAARDPSALAAIYAEIGTELRQLYRLGYAPARTERDGRWRTVSVRISGRPLVARTRAGYYAPRAGPTAD